MPSKIHVADDHHETFENDAALYHSLGGTTTSATSGSVRSNAPETDNAAARFPCPTDHMQD